MMDINKVKEIIIQLDKKTNLRGQDIPIEVSNNMIKRKGYFRYKFVKKNEKYELVPIKFVFSKILFDGRYEDDVVKYVIYHEYIHYYTEYYNSNKPKSINHGIEFKLNCKKFGISSNTFFKEKITNFENVPKKDVYVIKCNRCDNEMIRLKKSKLVTHIDSFRCICGGKLEVTKEQRYV